MRKTLFLTSKKEDQVARIGVRGGLGDSGNARKKTFFFYWCLPLDDKLEFLKIEKEKLKFKD